MKEDIIVFGELKGIRISNYKDAVSRKEQASET